MKRNKILFVVLLAGIIGASITSCSSDFLDEKLTTQYSTDRLKTTEGLDELSTGAYQKLKFKFNYVWGIELFNLGVDEFTDANNSIPSYNCYSADLNSAESDANSPFWDNMYGAIESANTLIQNVPLYYDQSNPNYNTRLGEGYFMRGYFYLQLVAQYGGVPLKLAPSTSVDTYYTRASEEECFAQIIADLEQAYDLLPTTPAETGRITKWAAAHYLAKAHLTRASELYSSWNASTTTADLAAVIKYGSEVVAAHPLCDDYVNLWDYQKANSANEKVSEVVLAAQFSDDQTTWGRYGNQMHLYYPSVYQDIAGTKRDISGGREFSYARATNYTMDVFDRVNDSRFWKSFITCYGCNTTSGAPTWSDANAKLGPRGTVAGSKRFTGGELAIKYVVNDAGDSRYEPVVNDATGVLKDGIMQNTHTFVRYFNNEPQAWVGKHGNEGYYGIQKRSVALSKYRDGYRISIASQFGTRDAILARSAEDVLMVAEAYARQGEAQYDNAIIWINKLRDRAAFKEGEDRSVNVDGGQAYKNNSYCTGNGGGYSSDGAVYWDKNTYYESNDDMSATTASTKAGLHINSVADIYNSKIDSPIYAKLGCTSNADKMMCFILNERTRELCGETLRWEDLVRTKTLEARWKAFNDGYVRGNTAFSASIHYYRPIPQTFLDAITNENGKSLTSEEKAAMQNPGY
ncbi:RagB/SusD family nutrient uptake outer membrane protein [uncultured Bacteroides sp.]|uniref:RagB/SusD family nutrient uptake outer membrane protein n=1 Tax=uncultured Bacteroides sp. TaxID=162156 RepID=UPI002AA78FB3|nr:RagB/SusD family nutrient uptake outer membrane protein [uncultured Bacteroides sp.]